MKQIDPYPYPHKELVNMDLTASGAHNVLILKWLLAETDYLFDLERRLHKQQWESKKHYKKELIQCLRWLAAEARWHAEQWQLNFINPERPAAQRPFPLPWWKMIDSGWINGSHGV